MSDKQLSRRRVVLGTGALAAATTSGIALTSDKSTAKINGTYTIPDKERVLADSELKDVRLKATVDWGFTSNAPIHGIEVELHVGANQSTLGMIARHENKDLGTSELTGTEELTGSLLNTDVFDAGDFTPTSGELSTSVISELRFYVIRDSDVVAEATQSDGFTVTIRNEELVIEPTLSGSGEVVIESS